MDKEYYTFNANITYAMHVDEITSMLLVIFNTKKTKFVVNQIIFYRLLQPNITGIFFELA